MKVLLLSRYDRLGASSRLRMMQYLSALAGAGIDVHIAPFFDDDYLRRLYAGRNTQMSMARAFLRRIGQLRAVKHFDLVWLEKEALPWLPWPIERALLESGVPIVSDYDDATFHNYDLHEQALVRRTLGAKIDRVMAASAIVIAGNAYLAGRAKAAGAARVEIVPTVVDTAVYGTRSSIPNEVPRMGWIGTPSTWTAYVEPLLPTFAEVAESANASIHVVGASDVRPQQDRVEFVDWSEDREVELIQAMDIGVMPLDDSPWARGKCGYKLIQYMACGLPVVASPVGVNAEIVEHGVNGFLATTEDDWRHALHALLSNSDLRKRMGAAGRRKVEQEYSIQVYGPKVASMLCDVALQGRGT